MTDKSKSLIERAETVIEMIRYCTAFESCNGCPGESNPDCKPMTTAKEIIVEMMNELPVWLDADVELPADCDTMVLCLVTGAYGNIQFENACCLGNYYAGEGWVLETWPEWKNPGVTYWMELPEVRDEH